tara:strand:+ start:13863 stop:14186 length:324 start_codon:yes stop_codon:yes gene_type:complete
MSVWQGVTNFKACTTHHNDEFYTPISSTHTVWHILEGRTARLILIKWPFRRFYALLLIFEAHLPVAVQWTDDRDSTRGVRLSLMGIVWPVRRLFGGIIDPRSLGWLL